MNIILKKNEERRLKTGHQWIFSNEIQRTEGYKENGCVANLFSNAGNFLGKGFYNKNSLISYRHLTDKNETIDRTFILNRLISSDNLRKRIFGDRKTYRLSNGESDYLPGLIIDKYENYYSIQIYALGTEKFLPEITDILKNEFSADIIIERNNNEYRQLEGIELREGVLYKKSENITNECSTEIDGIKFTIDLLKGQKTGFYLDQSENRKILRKYVNQNSRVLDLFCNDGGFSLNAKYAGAEVCTGIDSSEQCINTARKNIKLNNLSGIEYIKYDVFSYIKNKMQENYFDLIVIDPPSFTKSRKSVNNAVQGYLELNSTCFKNIQNNSIIFTFSCSHYIDEKLFKDIIVKSSKKVKKQIRILEYLGNSPDHTILPSMPETKYLKGFVLYII